jgi:hypothetical protein
MQRHRWVRLGATFALAAAAAGFLIAGPVLPAVGFFSPPLTLDVRIDSPAILIARGAALDVSLDVVCTSKTADLSVQVTERAGADVAQGFGFKSINCEGDLQTVHVSVTAQGGKAFKRGTGFAQAQIFGCVQNFCGQENDSRQIDIRK